MKATGRMICSMVMEKKYGQITLGMKESTMKARNMERALMCGQMAADTKETGMKTA